MARRHKTVRRTRRRMSEFLLVVIAVGALILVQAGATSIAGYFALRDARAASDDLYAYVSTVTIERVSTYVGSAGALAGTLQERAGGERTAGITNTAAIASPPPAIGADERPAMRPLTAQELVTLIRPHLQISSAMLVYPDGGYLAAFRNDQGFTTIGSAGGSSVETYAQYGAGLRLLSTATRDRTRDWRESAWYGLASGSDQVSWIEPARSELAETAVAGMAVGAYDASGTLRATVLVELDIAAISAYLTGLPLGGDGEAFILSEGRRVVAAPLAYRDMLESVERDTGMAPAAEDIGLGSPAPGDDGVYEDGPHRTLDTPFGETTSLPWTLQLRADSAQLSPGLTAFQRTLTWYFAVVAALTVISGLVIVGLRRPMLRLRAHASTDPLTGLANRREFVARGDQIVDAATKRGERVVVVMMDLDRLKDVNDRLGHATGDAAIRSAAEALGSASGSRDVVARLGGDEFAVVRWLAPDDDAAAIVEAMRLRVARSLQEYAPDDDAEDSLLGATAGYAQGGQRRDTLSRLLERADDALIAGKRVARGATYRATDVGATSRTTQSGIRYPRGKSTEE